MSWVKRLIALAACAFATCAAAQTPGPFLTSQILTAAQLNGVFATKLDTTLPSGDILLGNGSNVAAAVAISGDMSLSNAGVATLSNSSGARSHLGLGSAATQNVGTSGANVPLLNGANTWAATQTFSVAPVFTDQSGSRSALGLGSAAIQNIGVSGPVLCLLNTNCIFGGNANGVITILAQSGGFVNGSPVLSLGGPMFINPGTIGAPSPRNNTTLQLVSPNHDGAETTVLDAFSINAANEYGCERYDYTSGPPPAYTAVQAGENVCIFGAEAFNGSGDPLNGMLAFIASENQTPTHNGMAPTLWYTPNASTALKLAWAVNTGGCGGVTIGGSGSPNTWNSGPTDLCQGSLHTGDDLVSDDHIKTTPTEHGQPGVSSCGGTGASLQEGTDQAGLVKMGTGTPGTTCQINFASSWGSTNPICQVQFFNFDSLATPNAIWVSTWSATTLTVTTHANYTGQFTFKCMGIA